MICGSCAIRRQRTLGRQPGVHSAEVHFVPSAAHAALDEQATGIDRLRAAVSTIGYELGSEAEVLRIAALLGFTEADLTGPSALAWSIGRVAELRRRAPPLIP